MHKNHIDNYICDMSLFANNAFIPHSCDVIRIRCLFMFFGNYSVHTSASFLFQSLSLSLPLFFLSISFLLSLALSLSAALRSPSLLLSASLSEPELNTPPYFAYFAHDIEITQFHASRTNSFSIY